LYNVGCVKREGTRKVLEFSAVYTVPTIIDELTSLTKVIHSV